VAANKIHLRNVDKSYKLEPTDRKTSAGRIIYKNTKTGELHSEISVTLEYPEGSGNWINVPSLINGRVYNTKGVLAMLEAGKVTPNSTGHLTQDAAVQAAIYRSNNLQQLPATNEDIIGADIKPEKVVSLSDAVNSWNSSGVQDVKNYERPATFEVDIRDEDMMRKFDNATQYSPPIRGFDYKTADDFLTSTGTTARINAHMNANQAELTDNRTFGEKFTNAMTRAAGVAEMSYPGPSQAEIEAKRQNDLIESIANKSDLDAYYAEQRKNLQDNEALQGVMKQLEETKGINVDAGGYAIGVNIHDGEPVYEGTPITEEAKAREAAKQTTRDRNSFSQPGPHIGEQSIKPYLGKSWESPVTGPHMGEEVIKATTPDKKSKFEYKPHMTPEQKMNAGKNLTGLTPNYGKMPGFKWNPAKGQKSDQGYFDVDEKSDFWKTDAGYEKAKQTWGRDGGPLPHFVKKPKPKEFDMKAVRKWFTG
jgi:hypothetical protein